MNKPVIISGQQIGEDDLRQYLADTEKLTGSKITLVPQWVVTSDSPNVEMALEALFGGLGIDVDAPVIAKVVHKAKRGKGITVSNKASTFKLKPSPAQELKSWRVLDADGNMVEQLSIEEKNLRLASGAFVEGTILHHPKAGKQRVLGAQGSGQGLMPVDAA